MHEASLHESNCFITLTYSDEHLPSNYSVDVTHFQKFMKRLRKRFGSGVRYYHCGEYGAVNLRPHYHACLFNFDFPDKSFWRMRDGNRVYLSQALSELWPFGMHEIGDVTFESAAYCARYVTKKITGDSASDHYSVVDLETGEVFDQLPEYCTMSRRPAIGKGWVEKYGFKEIYPDDFIVIRGSRVRVPRYYDQQLEIADPNWLSKIKGKRIIAARAHADNNTPERLHVRERVQLARAKLLTRKMERET